MPRRKRKKADLLQALKEKRDFQCELCHAPDSPFMPLDIYFIDRDPTNKADKNLALLCAPCAGHFRTANPDGLTEKFGQFAFVVNRNLYPKNTLRP